MIEFKRSVPCEGIVIQNPYKNGHMLLISTRKKTWFPNGEKSESQTSKIAYTMRDIIFREIENQPLLYTNMPDSHSASTFFNKASVSSTALTQQFQATAIPFQCLHFPVDTGIYYVFIQ